MLCSLSEMCAWPSDSCITILRMKGSDNKCRKKEWNELKKLSIHGGSVRRALTSSFINLVSIEENCNGDQLDVCAVPISPWEQDSVTSLSICSEDDSNALHRSRSSAHLEIDSDLGFEKSFQLVLKKSSSSPSLIDKKQPGNKKPKSTQNLGEDEFTDLLNDHDYKCYQTYSERIKLDETVSLMDDPCLIVADGTPQNRLNDCSTVKNERDHETCEIEQVSELLHERDESGPTLSPVFLLIRSCFPFLFRSKGQRN